MNGYNQIDHLVKQCLSSTRDPTNRPFWPALKTLEFVRVGKNLWCGRGDLNPHASRRHPLKMVCLPISPLPHDSPLQARKGTCSGAGEITEPTPIITDNFCLTEPTPRPSKR